MKKNVLFIETGSGYGGTGKYLFELVKGINRAQVNPYVIYCGEGTNIQKVKAIDVPMWRLNLTVRQFSSRVGNYLYLLFWFFGIALPNSLRILRVIRQNKIDIVYLNNEILTHVPSIIAARLSRRKIVCHNHGLRQLTSLEKIFARYIDRFIAVSYATREIMQKDISNKNITVVHNGLNSEDYDTSLMTIDDTMQKLQKDNKLIGMFGRIVDWKGHKVFVRAALEVLNQHTNVMFIIVGDDITEGKRYLKELKSLIADLGVEDRLLFTGWKENPLNCVIAMDIVIHPSIQPEPFGLSAIEAMALGKPVVASEAGAIPEIIEDGVSGILFPAGDSRALAEKIDFLLTNASLRARIGKNAQERIKNQFSIEQNVQTIENVLKEV